MTVSQYFGFPLWLEDILGKTSCSVCPFIYFIKCTPGNVFPLWLFTGTPFCTFTCKDLFISPYFDMQVHVGQRWAIPGSKGLSCRF